MRGNTRNSPKVIIDTSTFYSALYNRKGNESYLFVLSDVGMCSIHILDYVLDELKEIYQKRDMDFHLVLELLENIDNIYIDELKDITEEEVQLAKRIIPDLKDRPIFIYSKRMTHKYRDIYLVSGDKGFFKKEVSKELDYRVLRTREFIEMITEDDSNE